MTRHLTIACVVLSFAAPTGASAQGRFDDLWWGLAVEAGATRMVCDICQPEHDVGPAATVSFGAYASPGLLVGLEGGAWTHDDVRTRETVYRAGVTATLSPDPEGSFHLLGGFGWSAYRSGRFRYDAPRLTLGLGWDKPLAPGWRIGNRLAVDVASFGSLKNRDVTVARRVGMSVVRFSVHLRRG